MTSLDTTSLSVSAFANWLASAPGGDTLIYFTGHIGEARNNDGAHPTGDAALAAERAGRVFLTQRLLSRDAYDRGTFAYIATKSGRAS